MRKALWPGVLVTAYVLRKEGQPLSCTFPSHGSEAFVQGRASGGETQHCQKVVGGEGLLGDERRHVVAQVEEEHDMPKSAWRAAQGS